MTEILYIGPGLGVGTIILIFLIGGVVIFAFGYIIWMKLKTFFKKSRKKEE